MGTEEETPNELAERAPRVSIIVVARNAQAYLAQCLEDLVRQDWPTALREFVLVDGESADGTRRIMEEFSANYPAERVTILRNPKRILASGWNVALENASGEVVVRLDAHSRVPRDFIRRNVEHIRRGESIVGGARVSIPGDGFASRLLWLAETSPYGAGQARYRRKGNPGYVDTLAHAAYRRQVYQIVGGYDERLTRNQDNEIHHRMRRAGFRFYYSPEIVSSHYVRDTPSGFLKQKFLSGLWIGLTLAVEPFCFRLRHFVPLGFCCALLVGFVLPMPWRRFTLAVLVLYMIAAFIFSVTAALRENRHLRGIRERILAMAVLPWIFLSMHLAYGIGTWIGVLAIPYFGLTRRKFSRAASPSALPR